MVNKGDVPKRGEIIWLDLNPTKGREQSGMRPVLVLSHDIFNKASELFIVCPITSRKKGYPYEVMIPASKNLEASVVLVDQIRSVSWKVRKTKYIATVHPKIFAEVLAKIETLIR